MQKNELEFEFTPSILDTPSLMTPNIVLNAPPIKITYNPLQLNLSTINEDTSISKSSTISTNETSLNATSADVNVSKIESELKRSFNERKPTPSPFQKFSSSSPTFILDKPNPVPNTDDGATIDIPSTADVVKELEALTGTNSIDFPIKTLINDNNERDTVAATKSPKKQFLMRSQSRTEVTSPMPNNNNNINNNNTNLSQSQKTNNDNSILNTQNGLDDENSMDDSQFTRLTDLQLPNDTNINTKQQFKVTIDNGNESHLNVQLRPDQNGIYHPTIKQQPVIPNPNKRTFQQANIGNTIPTITKTNTIVIPQSSLNEVTSTGQSSPVKRQKTAQLPLNTTPINFRTSSAGVPTLTMSPVNALTTNGSNTHGGSDDQRKKQIRDSNREAARRCRERRRQYIEQLEGNLEQYKAQIKQLGDKLTRIERENTQLRAILSETKLLHPSSRLSLNESHVDYVNVVKAAGIDLNSDLNHQTDGGMMQRNYMNRNNL